MIGAGLEGGTGPLAEVRHPGRTGRGHRSTGHRFRVRAPAPGRIRPGAIAGGPRESPQLPHRHRGLRRLASPRSCRTPPHRDVYVARLQRKFATVVAGDHQHGGMRGIETRALELAAEAMNLQDRGSAGQRVRGQLYAVAAAFTSSAMWAAIDGRRFDAAQRHHDRASRLAGMSSDRAIQFRIWSHAGTLYRHLGRPSDALAANDVARNLSIARRDPLFGSLGHARHAAIHGTTGDRTAVRRSLGHAQEALDRQRAPRLARYGSKRSTASPVGQSPPSSPTSPSATGARRKRTHIAAWLRSHATCTGLAPSPRHVLPALSSDKETSNLPFPRR